MNASRIIWLHAASPAYECCWPETRSGRKSCERPVEYVALSKAKRLPAPEQLFERNGFGLCRQHWGKRNA